MRDAITDESIQGLGHLKKVFAAFEKLAPVGTERDTASNRTLLFSHYASLILLSMFNPAMQCVRGLSDASALKKGQRLTPDETGGDDDKRSVLAENPEPNNIYLGDRGYERYLLLGAIVHAGSHYVIRCQERPARIRASQKPRKNS